MEKFGEVWMDMFTINSEFKDALGKYRSAIT
jgi:hypothetical protein